ncbi:hypothetical protein [Geobacter sp. SVR]|uniref:hypothetical protein n=1 Tax=Geobacter sp. SVR TaxID=2495594 RepID=UPI00143F04A3|nr:hypothetical protein [Geobacter sp. SVR]BCS54222.1 hypothetical protein GSVR_25300 [Geobacter sp. SVR]GCF85920.1 hypothetical protein GSbR_25200 [Geobacter sp. SVR]
MKGIQLFPVTVLLGAALATPGIAAVDTGQGFGSYSGDAGRRGGSEREKACACCRDCRSATRDVKPQHNGVPATNGCRDCCEKCGPENLPTDKERIPEKMKPDTQ